MGRRARAIKQRHHDQRQDQEIVPEFFKRRVRSISWLNWMLLETPSGFAVFNIDTNLMQSIRWLHIWANFIKDYMATFVWLRQFQEFEDKSAAINRTNGVGKKLRDMLKAWCRRGDKLLVASLEYKQIIEADRDLGVTCLYDDSVMEVMWGMKNLMHHLVPQEEKLLTKEERLPMSKGLQMLLRRHNFDVKPEMVNDDTIVTACFLYDSDLVEKKHSRSLHKSDADLMEISGFNTPDWDTIKLATALKKIAYPNEKIQHPPEMFSEDELSKIHKDASKYKKKIKKHIISTVYEDLLDAHNCKVEKLGQMRSLVEEATKYYDDCGSCQEPMMYEL